MNKTAARTSPCFPALGSASFLPRRYRPGNLRTWSGHLPFAHDLIASLQPRLLVELGTHFGESYFGFCQSVEETGIVCACYAVDSWRGDSHAGEYGDEVWQEVDRYNDHWYSAFSHLLRSYFDDALSQFSDESIDLLHIDGMHTYAAVKHDWDTWFPKVAPGGIILLHDIAARHLNFGVWKLWDELSPQYESFEFHHTFGLGVIRKPGQSKSQGGVLDYLFAADNSEAIRRYYLLCSHRLDYKADLEGDGDRSNGQVFQLFYAENGRFSEEASISTVIEPGPWRRLSFELPRGFHGNTLRLDLGTRPAIVEIRSVGLLHGGDRRELWRCSPRGKNRCHFALDGTARLLPGDSVLEVFSYGSDPQMLLAVPDFVPRGEPLIFESWVRFDPDLSRLATDNLNGSGLTPYNNGALAIAQPALADFGRRRLFVDPGNELAQALADGVRRGGREAGFSPMRLHDSALGRNDWTPVERAVTVRAVTTDPWIVCPVDLNAAEVRFFVITMSCSVDGTPPVVQLFWRPQEQSGFQEGLSIRFPVLNDGREHLYVVDLCAGAGCQEGGLWPNQGRLADVRLDPLNQPGIFRVSLAGFVLEGQRAEQLIRKALHLP